MTRFLLPVGVLLLAACSGGKDEAPTRDDTAAVGPLQKAEPPAPDATTVDADMPKAAEEALAPTEPATAGDGQTIPAGMRGRWALKAADCTAKKGTDLSALTIDAKTLRYFESAGELTRVRESDANHIVADYKFSGEGMDWDRRMTLTIEGGGKTLVRRDDGEGAAGEPMRYTRCA